METNPTRLVALLVGLDLISVLGLEAWPPFVPLRLHIETRLGRPGCPGCGANAHVKDRTRVELVDLPAFGRPVRLVWHKRRWRCANRCGAPSWTEEAPWIASPRLRLTARAGRWATVQVGRHARSVNEVASELGCDWHTVMDAVAAYGDVLINDPARIRRTDAVGLDEVLMGRVGRFRRQRWSTQVVDIRTGQLLDVIEGRDKTTVCDWFAGRDQDWREGIRWATLDMSGSYRAVFDTMLPRATQVVDPFHLVKAANQALDETRRRVQNDTLGHRGRKHDPLWRSRRLLQMADERLPGHRRERLKGLLDAGDPKGEVRLAWHAKEVVRSIYAHTNPATADEFVTRLAQDLQDEDCPSEVNRLGHTLAKWRHQITAWHRSHVTNAATEGVNNLLKRVKRAAFGFTNFAHYRIRVLLYTGGINWDLLPTATPR